MATPTIYPARSADRDLVHIAGTYAVGSDGSITSGSLDMTGAASVVRSSAGLHTITLSAAYSKLVALDVNVIKTTGQDLDWQVSADAALSGPTVALLFSRRTSSIMGGLVAAPTSASTQDTGTGATVWRVNVAALLASVNGVAAELAAAADFAIHDTTQLVTNGQSCVAALVLKNDSGVSMVAVKGTAATTGAQVAPTDTAIQTAVGAGIEWIKLAECTINRTGDTTVTQSQNNLKRPFPGVAASGTGDKVVNVADPKSATILVGMWLRNYAAAL